MSQRYAVLEWEGSYEDGDGWASVIATDQPKYFADWLTIVAPKGCARLIVTMAEYEESKQLAANDEFQEKLRFEGEEER